MPGVTPLTSELLTTRRAGVLQELPGVCEGGPDTAGHLGALRLQVLAAATGMGNDVWAECVESEEKGARD